MESYRLMDCNFISSILAPRSSLTEEIPATIFGILRSPSQNPPKNLHIARSGDGREYRAIRQIKLYNTECGARVLMAITMKSSTLPIDWMTINPSYFAYFFFNELFDGHLAKGDGTLTTVYK